MRFYAGMSCFLVLSLNCTGVLTPVLEEEEGATTPDLVDLPHMIVERVDDLDMLGVDMDQDVLADVSDIADIEDIEDVEDMTDGIDEEDMIASMRGVFVASGNVGRTLASFDDGRSWVADTSYLPGEVCTSSNKAETSNYCFEGEKAARGVAFADGVFYASFGWFRQNGVGAAVRRSRDGKNWEDVLTPGGFGGVGAGNGAVIPPGRSGTQYMLRSTNEGERWEEVGNGYGKWTNFRHGGFVAGHGGRFVFAADGNGFEDTAHVVVSEDGSSWFMPDSIPSACPTRMRLFGGVASIGDRIVLVGSNGSACHSDDGGKTWSLSASIGAGVSSHDIVSAGDRVYAWSKGRVHISQDGVTWTSHPTSPAGAVIGAVARSPRTGVFVAVTSGYLSGYNKQRFYRSEDGIQWTELPLANYQKGHPIVQIAWGEVLAPSL